MKQFKNTFKELPEESDRVATELFKHLLSEPRGPLQCAVRIGALRLFNRHEEVKRECEELRQSIESKGSFTESLSEVLNFFLAEQRSNKDLEAVVMRFGERFLASEE